jgi:hypothetical protein
MDSIVSFSDLLSEDDAPKKRVDSGHRVDFFKKESFPERFKNNYNAVQKGKGLASSFKKNEGEIISFSNYLEE